MNRLVLRALAGTFLLAYGDIACADRLTVAWLGPGGIGGEGTWNTPMNWDLGIVPDNGADGNGDGLPDIFDVRIDSLPPAMSLVLTEAGPIEIAGLSVDVGDTLELTIPLGFLLQDPDGMIEVKNEGLIRVGASIHKPAIMFASDVVQFSGKGTLELGFDPAKPGLFAAFEGGGRIINSAEHTIRTSGNLRPGRILGYSPDTLTTHVQLTNEGTILASGGGNLFISLNQETHFNRGTLRATERGLLVMGVDPGGVFYNSGLITAESQGKVSLAPLGFVNEPGGIISATHSEIVLRPQSLATPFQNLGMISAGAGGIITIEGRSLDHHENGSLTAMAGGQIVLSQGTFRPDPAVRVLDAESRLSIKLGASFQNAGNTLTPGPGILQLGPSGGTPAVIHGGVVDSGQGRLELFDVTLEDVVLRGTAFGGSLKIKGALTVDSPLTWEDALTISVDGDAVIGGPGVSRFMGRLSIDTPDSTLEIASDHRIEADVFHTGRGEVVNNGVITANTAALRGTFTGNGRLTSPEIEIGVSPVVPTLVSPGVGIGTMSLVGNVTFRHTSSLLAELGPDGSDLLMIDGDLSLNSEESLRLVGGLAGESYVITQYTGNRFGRFDNVTAGYRVIYDDATKQIRVQIIPEPGARSLLLVAFLALVAWRCRKR